MPSVALDVMIAEDFKQEIRTSEKAMAADS
jgi:hypothetical protein